MNEVIGLLALMVVLAVCAAVGSWKLSKRNKAAGVVFPAALILSFIAVLDPGREIPRLAIAGLAFVAFLVVWHLESMKDRRDQLLPLAYFLAGGLFVYVLLP